MIQHLNINNIRIFFKAIAEEPIDQVIRNIIRLLRNKTNTESVVVPIITDANILNIIKDYLFDSGYFIRKYYRSNEKIEVAYGKSKDEIWSLAINTNSKYLTPLFDYDYYVETNNFDGPPIDVIAYFLLEGFKKGHRPNPLFDLKYYVDQYPDVERLSMNPLIHFIVRHKIDYNNPNALFDIEYYLSRNIDIKNSGFNVLSHYIEYGFKEDRDPSILFNLKYIKRKYKFSRDGDPLREYLLRNIDYLETHPYFDGKYFIEFNKIRELNRTPLELYLDPAHFLKSPSPYFDPRKYIADLLSPIEMNPLIHFLNHTLANRYIKNVTFTDEMLEQIGNAQKLENLIFKAHSNSFYIREYSLPNQQSNEYILLKGAKSIIRSRANFIFIFSTLRRGGAELEALRIINSLIERHDENVILIYTDEISAVADDWCNTSDLITIIDFNAIASEVGFDSRVRVLVHLIEILEPKNIINVNSNVCWNMYLKYGRQISRRIKLDAMLFCYDYDLFHIKCGYAIDFLRDTIPYLNNVIIDNQSFIDKLISDLGLGQRLASKLKLLYQYPNEELYSIEVDRVLGNRLRNRPRVLWASRVCRQKRPDRFVEIARKLPNVDFHIWGYGNLNDFVDFELPDNLYVRGGYHNTCDLECEEYFAFIYTSDWDGLPNILIDMAKIGLPIITSDVGGICELVDDGCGWLISPPDEIDLYLNAIRCILDNDIVVRNKLSNMNTKLYKMHNKNSFDSKVSVIMEL